MANVEQLNAFGHRICEVREVLQDSAVESVIRLMRRDVFQHLGVEDDRSEVVIEECLEFARRFTEVSQYEREAHTVLQREGVVAAIPNKLVGRAVRMHQQISPYLARGSVFDLGCGDARLGALVAADGHEVQLADVYRNSHVGETDLLFTLIEQSSQLPFGVNQFDNTLLLTVLHHSDYPLEVLKEAKRVTRSGGNVILIESVYGVTGKELLPAQRQQLEAFIALTPEQQRMVNIFFDHFYNRVIHYTDDPSQKVKVPFNFNTPEGWKEHAASAGLRQTELVHLGLDQPTVPEYHTLHVLAV